MQNKFPDAKVYCVVVHACDCASVCVRILACVSLFDAVFNLGLCLSFVHRYSSSLLHGKDWRLRLICVLSYHFSLCHFLCIPVLFIPRVSLYVFVFKFLLSDNLVKEVSVPKRHITYANLIISWRKSIISLWNRKPLNLLLRLQLVF